MKPKIEKDPELERQKQQAKIEKVNAIQDRLSSDTDQSLRYYGSRRALSGAGSSSLVKSLTGV